MSPLLFLYTGQKQMIKSVKIENYKSIQSLEVDVGRFNVIIGENGAGKSNFLEIVFLKGENFFL